MKKIIVFCSIALVAVGFIWGYQRVNSQFPPSVLHTTPKGEGADYLKGITITAEDKEFLSKQKQEQIYQKMGDHPSFDAKILDVTVTLKNQTKEEKTFYITDINIETTGWAAGIAKFIIDASEGYGTIEQTLQSGEEKTIRLPYLILSNGFTKKDWEEIETREFWLTYTLYPEKKMLEL